MGELDNQRVCQRDCPDRSAECRLTCERYKAYRAKKEADYAERARVYAQIPDSPAKTRNIQRNTRYKFRGR